MVQEYQPRRFFRNAPNHLLQRYFAARNVLSEVDFGALTETQIEPTISALVRVQFSDFLGGPQGQTRSAINSTAGSHVFAFLVRAQLHPSLYRKSATG